MSAGIKALVEGVTDIALKAGEAILEVYGRGDFGATLKDGGSPLTLADEAAHVVIIEGLSRIEPCLPVLSEESKEDEYSSRRAWKRFWMVDPLDGTKEFIKRNGEFTVNIALIEDGSPVLGVVYAPVLGITYTGARGEGAFRIDKDGSRRIHAAGYDGGRPKFVGSRSHATPELSSFIERVGEAEFLSLGSSLKFCLVAEGAAHLYPRFGPTMEWDTAAAQAVVEAAGGSVTDLKGEPLSYNKRDLLNPFFMVTGSPPFPWREFLGDPFGG